MNLSSWQNSMLTHDDLYHHPDVTSCAPDWVLPRSRLVLLDEEMTEPCKAVASYNSTCDKIMHWFNIKFFLEESLE